MSDPQRVSVDFEILPDANDERSIADILDRIDNALRNSNSAMRSGASGFLLDGATFEVVSGGERAAQESSNGVSFSQPPVFQQPIEIPPAPLPSLQPIFPHADLVASSPRSRSGADGAKRMTDELLERITELLRIVDETKGERDKIELEKADLLCKLSESERALLEKMEEADKLRIELESVRKDAFYAKEELEGAKKNLAQAKEMWMKESARASKLREQLDKNEMEIADRKKELGQIDEKYKKTETENANLKHLLNNSNQVASTQVLTPQVLENSFPASDSYFIRGGRRASAIGTAPLPVSLGSSASLAGGDVPTGLSSRYLQLCVNNDGVLFEDEVIQIGIKAKFSGLGEGVLGVYFGNKTSGILQNFQVKYSMDTCGSGLHLTSAPVPSQLAPKSQVCQRVSAQITSSFTDCPRLTASFLLPDNTPRSIPLRLPVVINKFMQGKEDLLVEEFFSNWRQQLFLLNEASSVINVSMNLAQIARASQLGGALSLHHQVDEVPDNIVLVGQFPSDSPEGVRCATVPEALVLVRVEVGTGNHIGKARIAVRSNDPLVAESVRMCLVQQLGILGL